MKNDEAKFILHAYRPNGSDAGDATFAEALEQAKQDPSINQWFTAQQAFDRAMCAKLVSVAMPTGLRESILAGGKLDVTQTAQARPSWWRSPMWVGLAASAAVLLAVSVALWPQAVEAQPVLIDFALKDTLRMAHGGHGEEAANLRKTLSQSDLQLGSGVVVDFDELKKQGCRTISFNGYDVLEVCFNRDGKWFHCYVARASDFPAIAAKLKPTFRDGSGASAAAWVDGQHIFVIASKAGREAIQRLI